ncbi:sulfatase-like hydrolase/transferase [Planctomycetes bacterium K23_9]|uniref:Arylsulfatase n=1 Tax=Stieleria marina TaxID=1930275 RepID=A0A517NVG9_9BACT|nr:Arylsulfatase [Planctomycetes bacterium K23_9]
MNPSPDTEQSMTHSSCCFLVAAACLLPLVVASTPTPAADRPNILLIVSDDQRPDTIASFGNNVIRTPNLDALAARGSVFSRAICANPICTPSRGEILTGCNGFNNGVSDFRGKFREGLSPIAQTLGDAGYQTCYVGKWHNAGRPSHHGYQKSKGLFSGGGGKLWKDQVDAHGRPVTGYRGWIFQSDSKELQPELGVGLTPDISERFADAAIDAIATSQKSPFFVHVNFTAPHDPLLIPTGYDDAYDPDKMPFPPNFIAQHPFDTGNIGGRDEVLLPTPRTEQDVRDDLAVYYAVITHLDEQVGRILKSLDSSGKRDNTVVIFTSDHGLAMGSHGLRGKQNMYEHTMNVPMLMSGPSIPTGETFDAQMYLRDLYPTICELADVSLPNPIDGRSVVPVLRHDTTRIHEYVFGYFRDVQRMIRGDRWKLIHYPQIDHWQLFDLANDPNEQNNLADVQRHADIKRELQGRLRRWQLQVGDPLANQ